jgi:ribosomal protein S18 acetylase RimI-like enzyme
VTIPVRPGTADDWEAVCDVWRRADEARTGRISRPKAVRDQFVVVAEDDETIVGIAIGVPGREDGGAGKVIPGLAHLANVAVVPERWGQGFGAAVVERWCDEAWAHEYDRAQLFTAADNARAQALYERLGWARSGFETKNDLGIPIVHYERSL